MSISRSTLVLALLPLAVISSGCEGPTGIGVGGSGPEGGPTWAEDVAPILMDNCARCHREGGIAPFSIVTYEEAKSLAGAIKGSTQARTMPPENLDNSGDCNTYADARWLTDEQIATLAAWADNGAPEGDAAKAPPPPPPPGEVLGKSLTIDMGVSYTPNASVTDDYRCFIVDPGLTKDQFLTAYQVKPGEPRVVHHLILFAIFSDAAEQEATALDAADPAPGYTCYGGSGVSSSRFVAGWAPGADATYHPAGTGIRLQANRRLVMQIHYNLANGSFPDRTTIDLALKDSVAKEASITRVAAKGINLPPGQPLVSVTGQTNVPANKGTLTIYGVAPHMHGRGKTQDAWYEGPDGTKTCLSKVTDWNFHWQRFANYAAPLTLKAGGTLGVTCGYDTSHDTKTVVGGEGSDDEMCIDFMYVTQE
jgi:hypothetical protein